VIQPKLACLVIALVPGLCLLSATGESIAADRFPSSTVKIIVPNPAGGTADVLPRIIADALSNVWKQAVVVENRAGAAGNVGAESFSRAPADGYTLLASPPTTLAINQSLYKKLNVVDVLKTEDVRNKFLAQGAEPIGNTPQEMATFLERERTLWGNVIDKAKLKAPD